MIRAATLSCLAFSLSFGCAGDGPDVPAPDAPAKEVPVEEEATPPGWITPAGSLPRAVLVGEVAIACHSAGRTVDGSVCPAGEAVGLDLVRPGAASLTTQGVELAPGACGSAAVAVHVEPLLITAAPEIEVLPNDQVTYRALIAAAFGIQDPANAPGFRIDQLLRIDLDSDGTMEVLFSAQGQLGLRRVTGDGSVETLMLPAVTESGVPEILGVVDVEGDGPLELVAWTGGALAGGGPQWIGHWIIGGLAAGQTPTTIARGGCDQEGPPRPGGDH